MARTSTSFKPGNQAAKNRRRIAYDAIFTKALQEKGDMFMKKLFELCKSKNEMAALRACDIFFKFARPPENTEIDIPIDTTEVRKLNITKEECEKLIAHMRGKTSEFSNI